MASARPYSKYSIDRLEALYQAREVTVGVLRAIDFELAHRKSRRRVVRLRSLVAATLDRLDEGQQSKIIAPAAESTLSTTESPALEPQEANTFAKSQETVIDTPHIVRNVEDGGVAKSPLQGGPEGVLAAWTALEALSPQTFRRPEDLASGDRYCVADLSQGGVPWGKGERSRPKYRIYYQVILGSVPMDRATDDLVRAFGADEERSRRKREKAAIAAILVDKDGFVPEEDGVAVSSFAWALPLALKRQLNDLGNWTVVERKILDRLQQIVRRVDARGVLVPLDVRAIQDAYNWLVGELNLPSELREPPFFAIRVYQYYKSKTAPETSLLNSFFLADLRRASQLTQSVGGGGGLRRYLGVDKPGAVRDLRRDKAALEQALAPAAIPPARWPQPGGHPLVLLQQAAVNVVRSELGASEGVVAINGPPGTGKTTLLRDLIAQCVLDRALALCAFDEPESAFRASGQKMSVGDNAFFHLYALDAQIKGHEIVVASSNNKAVENVSRDIPAAEQVSRPSDDLAYFKSISDALFGKRGNHDEEDETPDEPVETWGLIAAVLGNAKNRSAFQRTFWWDDDRGFRLYLKAAKGDSVVREITDPETGKVIKRKTPTVVLAESPPTGSLAKANWRRARAYLVDLKRSVDADLSELERVRQLCLQLSEVRKKLQELEAECRRVAEARAIAEASVPARQAEVEAATTEYRGRDAAVLAHRRDRPGLFARLFRSQRWRAWLAGNEPLVGAKREADQRLSICKQALHEAKRRHEALADELRALEGALVAPRQKVVALEHFIDPWRDKLGDRLVDEQFFARGHELLQLSSAWLPDELQRKREDLFAAAMAVHKAFIDASAQKVLHNLSALMNVFMSGSVEDAAKRELLGDLWSTLFLVVPVISTTFASVDRMLGQLPPGSLGWLFIDEAGQAVPQAAVGAIMRARRTVVVGDPLQIPPVVSLPERLTVEICSFFGVDHKHWAAPESSVQVLGDRASRFQSSFDSDSGPRRMGTPLLVHRRCQEPMFGVSNAIAYNGLMVPQLPRRNPGPIGSVLGPSRWLNIDGDAESKWCPAEGDLVTKLLRKLAAAGVEQPDLFIITPFRIVAQSMQRRLIEERDLLSALRISGRKWLSERVGTIHTFQGDEADTVILVLGAPKASQHGARNWAAGTPNILNVAVSRAKQNFYVVGSHGAWSGVGHCRELAQRVPVARA